MIKIDKKYSINTIETDPNYPAGKAKAATTSSSIDGTPLKATWFNDLIGARQAIYKKAFGDFSKISNVPDNAEKSDILDALLKIIFDQVGEITDKEIINIASENLPTTKAVTDYVTSVTDVARTEILHCFVREKSWFFIRVDEENNVFLDYDETIDLKPPEIELDYEKEKFIIKFEYAYLFDIVRDEETGKTTMTLL